MNLALFLPRVRASELLGGARTDVPTHQREPTCRQYRNERPEPKDNTDDGTTPLASKPDRIDDGGSDWTHNRSPPLDGLGESCSRSSVGTLSKEIHRCEPDQRNPKQQCN